MARFLLLFIIGLIVVASVRGLLRRPPRPVTPSKSDGGENMVRCERCGVNLPRSEALFESGKFRCHDNPRCLP